MLDEAVGAIYRLRCEDLCGRGWRGGHDLQAGSCDYYASAKWRGRNYKTVPKMPSKPLQSCL